MGDGLTDRERKQKIVDERCKEKAKKLLTADRLAMDKDYLATLSRGIGQRPGEEEDYVEIEIAETAHEALEFLKSRQKFWRQIQLGESGAKRTMENNGKTKKRKHSNKKLI